jgi:hypothetical protein
MALENPMLTCLFPRAIALLLLLSVLVQAAEPPRPSTETPWKTNTPIVTVHKELYRKRSHPNQAPLVSVTYVGPKLEKRETFAEETESDVADNVRARWSSDNGQTWSEFKKIVPSSKKLIKGIPVHETEGACEYDPASGWLVQLWLRQVQEGNLWHNHTYVRYSKDLGQTWTAPQLLRYENSGTDFDGENPLQATFLNHNEGYFGNNILRRKDGTLVTVLAHANAPHDKLNHQRAWRMGSVLFVGKWNADRKDYDWRAGARVEITPDESSRGLMEPEVAELTDGRLLVVWRGSNSKLPGHKFFSISNDNGQTLAAPAVWTYDDGTAFYSPSSYHRMIRHSVTGKLYWLGNITNQPPSGNSPRYPLVIAQVDDKTGLLMKATVTLIDDRREGQGDIQFSNFSLLEDRKTHHLELYLTTYGEDPDPAKWTAADCYKYTLKLK